MNAATVKKSHRQAVLTAADEPEHILDVEGIPEGLTSLDRWVCWKWKHDGKKWSKMPIQPNGQNAASNDKSTWNDFTTVVAASKRLQCGIGFVFNGDGLVGIDLDDCRDPSTGELLGWAQDIVRSVDSYTEVSPVKNGSEAVCARQSAREIQQSVPLA